MLIEEVIAGLYEFFPGTSRSFHGSMKTFAILIAVITLSVSNARGQHVTLSGFITDSQNGEKLIGANVWDEGTKTGTATNAFGFYSITLPPGEHTIKFSYLGYKSQTVQIRLNTSTTLNIELDQASIGLEEVTVEAEMAEEEITSTQMGVVSIPVEEIKSLPAFLGEVDVIKTIQLLPGVQSGTEGSTGLYVRGGGPDQNLILLDGAPVYNVNHVFGFLSVFNADALQNVQLIKGGFPARYGGRLSSVVDLSMKEGNLKRYEADGTVGLVFSSLTLQGPILKEKASFIVSARRTYIDILARPFLNRRLPAGESYTSYFYDANAKLNAKLSNRSRLFLSLYTGQDVYGASYERQRTSNDILYIDRNKGGADWGNLTSTLRWNYLFSDRLFSNTTLSYSRYNFDVETRLTQIERSTPILETYEEVLYSSGIKDISAKIDFDYRPHPTHYFRFGANVVRHRFNPGVSRVDLQLADAGFTDTTLTLSTFPFSGTESYIYLEDDVSLTNRIKANIGIHASTMFVSGRKYTSIQPRLAARYLINPTWSVKTSFGTMQQYLHLLTNSGINLPTDLWLAATNRIKPQKAWQVAVGSYHNFGKGAYTLSLEGYYKKMDGLIEYKAGASFVSPNQDWQDKVEAGEGWSSGLEVLLRKKKGKTKGWIGYTLSWTRRSFDALNNGQSFPYRYDRRHDLSFVLMHQFSDKLDAGLTWVYGTGQAITLTTGRFFDGRLIDAGYFNGAGNLPELREFGPRGGYRMRSYHRLDFSLNWHFDKAFFTKAGKGTLAVGAYNAYSRRNPFYLFTTQEPDGSRQYRQASLFPVLPFISYRFSF